MNNDLVICAEGLGKRYWVGHETERERYVALRDVLARTARNAWRKTRDLAHGRDIFIGDTVEEFWALKDLSFEVRRGEVLGIIGRNGAGKSTLLKILSRITEPSEGRVTIEGRVASLLEVGTGFHPELTGRENIFLNGAILGMTRASIKRKFDEIVAFSDVEKFLDTPVKRYSSGMYVRLAFGVAAHLEPDILVVDEVLAVGDAEFQKKCLGKMSEVAGGGRTVLFVSHNMAAVRQLCGRSILLSDGRKLFDGISDQAISRYIYSAPSGEKLRQISQIIELLPPDPAFRLKSVSVLQDRQPGTHLVSGKPIDVVIEYEVLQSVYGLHLGILLHDSEGTILLESLQHGDLKEIPVTQKGKYVSVATIPEDFLAGKEYNLQIDASIHRERHCIPQPSPINIRLSISPIGKVNAAFPNYASPGKIAPLFHWETVKADATVGAL
jgi:lipopolysaccharide transport system ATP-binding protein